MLKTRYDVFANEAGLAHMKADGVAAEYVALSRTIKAREDSIKSLKIRQSQGEELYSVIKNEEIRLEPEKQRYADLTRKYRSQRGKSMSILVTGVDNMPHLLHQVSKVTDETIGTVEELCDVAKFLKANHKLLCVNRDDSGMDEDDIAQSYYEAFDAVLDIRKVNGKEGLEVLQELAIRLQTETEALKLFHPHAYGLGINNDELRRDVLLYATNSQNPYSILNPIEFDVTFDDDNEYGVNNVDFLIEENESGEIKVRPAEDIKEYFNSIYQQVGQDIYTTPEGSCDYDALLKECLLDYVDAFPPKKYNPDYVKLSMPESLMDMLDDYSTMSSATTGASQGTKK